MIHADELEQYEYLGFGDIDLIYGELGSWLKSVRKSTTVISTHIDRISGHFALFKNTPKVLKKAFRIPKWKELLTSDKHYSIDEGRFSFAHFPVMFALFCIFQNKLNMRRFAKRMCKILRWFYPQIYLHEMHTTPLPKKGEIWKYDKGHIYDPQNRELPYLHFLFFKKTQYNPGNENYWREGFYQIGVSPSVGDDCVYIDIHGIRYAEA